MSVYIRPSPRERETENNGWMDDMRFYVLFNSISVISGQWKVDKERLRAMGLRLRFQRFHLKRGSNSVS